MRGSSKPTEIAGDWTGSVTNLEKDKIGYARGVDIIEETSGEKTIPATAPVTGYPLKLYGHDTEVWWKQVSGNDEVSGEDLFGTVGGQDV